MRVISNSCQWDILDEQRIRSARILAGYTLRELSQRMGNVVSHTALAKYENGRMIPGVEVLDSLARALDVRKEYFFGQKCFADWKIIFRKMKGMSVAGAASLSESVSAELSRYLEIERLLGISPAFIQPLNDLRITTGDNAESASEQIRLKWKMGSGAIPSVTGLLEEQGIKIFCRNLAASFDGVSGWAEGVTKHSNVNGVSGWAEGAAKHSNVSGVSGPLPLVVAGGAPGPLPVILINGILSQERRRFVALRELGYLLLRIDKTLSLYRSDQICRRFCDAFLLPRETFFSELGRGRNSISTPELIRVKETYGIPVKSLIRRASELGVVNEMVYRTYCRRLSVNPAEKDLGWFCGREDCDRYKVLVFRAAAEGAIPYGEAAALLNQNQREFRMESEFL